MNEAPWRTGDRYAPPDFRRPPATPGPAPWRAVALSCLLLLVLLVPGLALRVCGIDFGLPFLYHPDEHNLAFRALDAAGNAGNPGWFEYPSLMMYLLWPVYAGYYAWLGLSSPGQLYEAFSSNPAPFHLLGRWLVAVLGTLTLPLVWWGGRNLSWPSLIAERAVPLFATALLAVAAGHVRDSHFLTVDVPTTFWATLALAALLRYLRETEHNPSSRFFNRWLALAAVAIGLATATKYTSILLLAPLAVACWGGLPPAARNLREWLMQLATCGVLICLTFALTTPYVLLDWNTFLDDFHYQLYTSSGTPLYGGGTAWRCYATHLWWALGPGVVFLCLAGLLAMAWRRTWMDFVVLVWIAVFAGWLCSMQRAWLRWMLPVLPALCLTAAVGADALASRLPRRPGRILFGLLLLAALAGNLWVSLPLVRLLQQEDTRTLAHRWAVEHLPAESRIWQTIFAIPFQPDDPFQVTIDTTAIADRLSYIQHIPHAPSPPAFDPLVRRGYRVFVLSQYATAPGRWPHVQQHVPWFADYTRLYDTIREKCELICIIHPDGERIPLTADDIYARYTHLDQARRPGPTLELYRYRAP